MRKRRRCTRRGSKSRILLPRNMRCLKQSTRARIHKARLKLGLKLRLTKGGLALTRTSVLRMYMRSTTSVVWKSSISMKRFMSDEQRRTSLAM
ncbi:hypothetical protein PRUPE_8G197200 [Prunus persica]|uniref:Uncharacterized protein n=1 Tax=Prunus persica TaxID=3760 RepID=A0A251N0D6_PRUPE|nr:hypothetical protein PRUPE_8G197200 [Prunus persica]